MNKTHWPNTLHVLIFLKDPMIEICNMLQLNIILFWFASDEIQYSVFQCNEPITAVWMTLIIAVYEEKFN